MCLSLAEKALAAQVKGANNKIPNTNNLIKHGSMIQYWLDITCRESSMEQIRILFLEYCFGMPENLVVIYLKFKQRSKP